MGKKEMEGDNRQRRAAAREAREQGKTASEAGATLGSSKQHARASGSETHQEKIDLKRQGKQRPMSQNTPEARPGSRDPDTADRERYPRMKGSDDMSAERGRGRQTRGDGTRA